LPTARLGLERGSDRRGVWELWKEPFKVKSMIQANDLCSSFSLEFSMSIFYSKRSFCPCPTCVCVCVCVCMCVCVCVLFVCLCSLISSLFFIRYFLHLYFKCYPKSPLHPPQPCSQNPFSPKKKPKQKTKNKQNKTTQNS
jgi:hypothetical protein